VPCVPGYHGVNQDPQHLLYEAEKIGVCHVFNIPSNILIRLTIQDFPSLSKAVHGGGGKGMRTVYNASAFLEALESAQREALKGFGNATVLVEKVHRATEARRSSGVR
jgi:3-methylcrotonyl-CoA carboxylase alpha subunit